VAESRENRRGQRRDPVSLDTPRESRPRLRLRPQVDPDAFGRASEGFARFMGTGRFLVYMTAFVALWAGWNILAPERIRFDSYPFIFLTLVLSLQASYAAPLILLAQNRQDDRDRVLNEQDRSRDERALADTEYLTREVAALRIALRDVATRDFVRSELRSILEELAEEGVTVSAGTSRDAKRKGGKKRKRVVEPGPAASVPDTVPHSDPVPDAGSGPEPEVPTPGG
jgi:uncharacterized membrane protein